MKKILIIMLILTIALTSCSQQPKVICEENNGTWLEDYSECEYLSKEICESNGGTFNECASACRHDENADICTMQCVSVCTFN